MAGQICSFVHEYLSISTEMLGCQKKKEKEDPFMF